MKGPVRIGGALVVGIAIVAGAWFVASSRQQTQESTALTVATESTSVTPTREYIPPVDNNDNGIPDWQEQITNTIVLDAESATATPKEYVLPDTLTAEFAQTFFERFIRAQEGSLPISQQELIELSVNDLDSAQLITRTYSRGDITKRVETTAETVRAYGNAVIETFGRYVFETENEVTIFSNALRSGTGEGIERLTPIMNAYQSIIGTTLVLAVPDELEQNHVTLLNAYQKKLTGIDTMRYAFSDPMSTMLGLQEYTKGSGDVLVAMKQILEISDKYGVRYEQDEPGSFFYYLE